MNNKEKQKSLFSQICNWENITLSYKKTQKGHLKYKPNAIKFNFDDIHNLKVLQKEILTNSYSISQYHHFKVFEPKPREVYAPAYRDKIVQHMVNGVLINIYEPSFIFDSYACIRNKGNIRALKRIQQFMRKSNWETGGCSYVLKLDVQKFFYSIDRDILKRLFRKKIKCAQTLSLIDQIVDSSPSGETGLPLGNLTSQLFANIYLNELDQYCKRNLRIQYYVRYADDIFTIAKNYNLCKSYQKQITTFLQERLHLTVHPEKIYVNKVKHGVAGLGFNIYAEKFSLLRQNKKRTYRKLKKQFILHKNTQNSHNLQDIPCQQTVTIEKSLHSTLEFIKLAQDYLSFITYLGDKFTYYVNLHHDSKLSFQLRLNRI